MEEERARVLLNDGRRRVVDAHYRVGHEECRRRLVEEGRLAKGADRLESQRTENLELNIRRPLRFSSIAKRLELGPEWKSKQRRRDWQRERPLPRLQPDRSFREGPGEWTREGLVLQPQSAEYNVTHGAVLGIRSEKQNPVIYMYIRENGV